MVVFFIWVEEQLTLLGNLFIQQDHVFNVGLSWYTKCLNDIL